MSQGERVRIVLDSNVSTAGIVSTWGLDKAVLSLCATRICRLVLAEAVREEVEENLLVRLGGIESREVNRVLDHYVNLIALMKAGGRSFGSRRRLSSFVPSQRVLSDQRVRVNPPQSGVT